MAKAKKGSSPRRGAKGKRRPAKRKPARSGWLRGLAWRLLVVFLMVASAYVAWLDYRVRSQFDGKRWSLPARVYARPLELYPGRVLSAAQLVYELGLLKYHQVSQVGAPGSYARHGERFDLDSRAFPFWDGVEPEHRVAVTLAGGRVARLSDLGTGQRVPLLRLDPAEIGGIYTKQREDRILVRLDQVPPLLSKALVAVEDRHFYQHFGISPSGIARAVWANLRAGQVVQGGSTITQQLVKNFYLSNARTLSRKANEAIMAILLDAHYSKDEILETYMNEVYLGQGRARAIHGFGLAAEFYFDRPVESLKLPQIALLVGLVKGPSYYDPRRHPRRATERRNVVLEVMAQQGLISDREAVAAKRAPLGVSRLAGSGLGRFPAFLGLVKAQLRRDYREKDLTTEGLRIFTTLDPWVQHDAETALSSRLDHIERAYRMPAGRLQGAVVVTGVEGGEVLAVVGDRNPTYAGFNRALDAVRQVGSLIKPAVYLTALKQPSRYTLATLLDDTPFSYRNPDGSSWTPHNYDRKYHDRVPLYLALAHSLNVATARMGVGLGVANVIETLRRLGIQRELKPYPSLLLGAAAMSPLEVTQMYHTLASGGFRTPLRSIRAVLDAHGQALSRYPLQVQETEPAAPVYLVDTAMEHVLSEGTARSAGAALGGLKLAGKTGTTDDLRDSWFAGFGGDRVAVVWVGRDDNRPAGLTGASGALGVWTDLMRRLGPEPVALPVPDNITTAWIQPATGKRTDRLCRGAVELPFIRGSEPSYGGPCVGNTLDSALEWVKGVFKGHD